MVSSRILTKEMKFGFLLILKNDNHTVKLRFEKKKSTMNACFRFSFIAIIAMLGNLKILI